MSDIAIKVEHLGKKYKIGIPYATDVRFAFKNFINNLRISKNQGKKDRIKSAEIWALQDIDFEVKKGEALGIIGPNGAGKSTLLKILSRITFPTTGKFFIDGNVSSLLEVGTGFHMELTGRENIFLNGTILGMKRRDIKKKFDEIVEFSGVEKFIDTPVKHYSSGMHVRLAFSVAAHLDSEILIIDEVLAVGDAEFQKKCLGKMEDVTGQGRTILFVSHNMGAVKSLCSHGLLLNRGAVNLNGKIEEVINEYIHKTIYSDSSARSGNGKMNLISLKILDEDEKEIKSMNSYDHIIFETRFRAEEDINNVSVALGFNNINNTRITSLWSQYFNKTYNLKKGEYIFKFDIPKLKLIPGMYEIFTYAEVKGEIIEKIDNLLQVIVGTSKEHEFVQIPSIDQGVYNEEFTIDMIPY